MTRKELIHYCLTFPLAYEDYPFEDHNWTVMRHSMNKKGFAFIYERGGRLYINLKCEPVWADFLRGVYKDVTAGYHMNKTHWNTVMVGGDVPGQELREMLSHSYELIKPKLHLNRDH